MLCRAESKTFQLRSSALLKTIPTLPLFGALALVLTITSTALHAQVPGILNYQGRVAVGTPAVNFEGSGAFKFALVDGDTTTYWSNDGTSSAGSEPATVVSLPVVKGLYSVLPNMTAIPASAFSSDDVRLRVWLDDGVNGSQLLTPDQRIAAVGYAMVAGGLAPGASLPASALNGTFPASQVATAPPGMVLIPVGPFTMGDNLDGMSAATPTVSTTVSAFYMDVNLVSLSQWQAVKTYADANGYTFTNAGSGKGATHPVQTVDWWDCVKWCNARSQQAGRTPAYYTDAGLTTVYKTGEPATVYVDWVVSGYRLPTEAEWEKAARGGRSNQRFPWGNTISHAEANFRNNGGEAYQTGSTGYHPTYATGGFPYTSPVGSFPANGYGLNDMAGNVFQWCWDWYGTPYAGGSDPYGPGAGSYRVFRGGSWDYVASIARCANRYDVSPTDSNFFIGFRSVLPPGQ